MTKEIDFYFDFISPYTYLAYKKIQSLPKNIKINYKLVLLGGLHNLQEITAPAFINSKLQYIDKMFKAYWKDNLDISSEETLISLLEKCKIDINNFFKKIIDPIIKDKLKDVTKEAYVKGIFGATTFIVNNKMFWEQDRLNYALDEYNY